MNMVEYIEYGLVLFIILALTEAVNSVVKLVTGSIKSDTLAILIGASIFGCFGIWVWFSGFDAVYGLVCRSIEIGVENAVPELFGL